MDDRPIRFSVYVSVAIGMHSIAPDTSCGSAWLRLPRIWLGLIDSVNGITHDLHNC